MFGLFGSDALYCFRVLAREGATVAIFVGRAESCFMRLAALPPRRVLRAHRVRVVRRAAQRICPCFCSEAGRLTRDAAVLSVNANRTRSETRIVESSHGLTGTSWLDFPGDRDSGCRQGSYPSPAGCLPTPRERAGPVQPQRRGH